MPAPSPGVAGVLPGEPPLTVIAPLTREKGSYVIVVSTCGKTFGLLVDSVTGLRKVDEKVVRVAPDGQRESLVSGTLEFDGRLTLVTDPAILASTI